MPLVQGFLQTRFTREIPKYKYLVGVVVGLLMAFFLYALQYMTRELIRVSSASEDEIWMLSDVEVNFYNLIFAFIAVIVGQSFCLEYWFNQPRNFLSAKPGRLQNIIHEQRFLNWYFLAWFSKVATMYGLLFCTAGLGHFYLMSFYPDFNYVLVLMVIVLFLQTWNGLLLTFKRRAFKWMLVSLIVISTFSFGLSKVDIVDYKSLNEMVINNRLDVQYNLRIPNSSIYRDKSRGEFRHLPNISLAIQKGNGKIQPLLFVGQKEIYKGKLPLEILQMRAKQYTELQNLMPVFLRIDKEVPMSFVHEIKRELAFVSLYLLNYVIIPSDAKYDKRYYAGWNRTYLTQYNVDFFALDYDSYLERAGEVINKIEISVSNKGYEIDGIVIPLNKLAAVLRKRVSQNLDYAIILNFKENINFDIYLGVISKINEAVYSLRDEAAFKEYAVDYKTLEEDHIYGVTEEMREIRKTIVSKYHISYVENWSESGIRLPKKTQPDFTLPEIK